MHIYLTTLGCRLNEAEIESWTRQFQAAGHEVVQTPQQAQVLVLNSCAVTIEAARKSRQFANRLHRQNPAAKLVVTGCYAELEPERVAALTGVDLVIGNGDKDRLPELIATELDLHAMPDLATGPDSAHVYREARTRAFIKVQDGCRNRCTFCIVTIARGEERSRSISKVVEEISLLHASGYQEAVLTGVHLGGYGNDLRTDLYALVESILRNTDIPRLRLSSLEPWDLHPSLFDLWDNPRLMPHLHLPLQSGCDSVLRRMARRYTTAEYANLVRSARAAIPDLSLTTDLLVGFPGETESEWAVTVDYVQEMSFAHTHIFSYSPRPGTVAARMNGDVHGEIKRARSRQMHDIAARMKAEHLARFVGHTRPVLWEGAGYPQPGGKAREDGLLRWSGYTNNYLRVETVAPPGSNLENRILPATLTSTTGNPPDRLYGRAATRPNQPSNRKDERPLVPPTNHLSHHD